MSAKRTHYWHPKAGYHAFCGTVAPVKELWGTTEIPAVTCHLCLAKLWMDIRLAHYRANPGQDTPSDRAIRNVLRSLERATYPKGKAS